LGSGGCHKAFDSKVNKERSGFLSDLAFDGLAKTHPADPDKDENEKCKLGKEGDYR
jgi:hypothetical protein